MAKICRLCRESKEESEYTVRSEGTLRSECKPCLAEYHRAYRVKNAEKNRIYKAKWAADHYSTDPVYRENVKSRARNSDPLKKQARRDVKNAISRGDIVRENCAFCGSAESQAHHEDYSKPLDIIWVCSVHHGKLHRRYK